MVMLYVLITASIYTTELRVGRPAEGSDLGIEVSSSRHRRSTVIVCTTS